VNFVGAVSFATCVVPQLLAQGAGQIAFVASVAGYRGLPKSLIYGPTKAALINFAEALYIDLEPKGIGVRIINPGFVATPLTAQNDFAMPALLTPEAAAQATLAGFAGSAFEIDYPKRFTRVMKLLAHLPYRLYFPLVRRLTGA
jgi:short-subunit dehydrogenase